MALRRVRSRNRQSRAAKGVVQRCGICGRKGHRSQTCQLPGPALVKSLRARLKGRGLWQKKPKRKTPTASTRWRKKARKAYTPQPQQDRRKPVRRQSAAERKGTGLPSKLGADALVALNTLRKAGYLQPAVKKCCVCKGTQFCYNGVEPCTWERVTATVCRFFPATAAA